MTSPILTLVASIIVGVAPAATTSAPSETRSNKAARPHSLGQNPLVAIASSGPVKSTVVDTGYVVLNGQYLAPPYVIRASEAGFAINDQALSWEQLAFAQHASIEFQVSTTAPTRRPPAHRPLRPKRRSAREVSGRVQDERSIFDDQRQNAGSTANQWKAAVDRLKTTFYADVVDLLSSNAAVVHLKNEPVLLAYAGSPGDSVVSHLISYETKSADRGLEATPWDLLLPATANSTVWRAWLAAFQPPRELIDRGIAHWNALEDRVAQARASQHSVSRIDAAAYPLSVLGMLLGIAALGHLLRSVPNPTTATDPALASHLQRATKITILLIAALSFLDLTWTILAAQAGTMKELNPLGAQLIGNPTLLTVFKLLATATGCGILYKLRSHHRAADASWWMCLVMTVVTFRWVMFNSMFA